MSSYIGEGGGSRASVFRGAHRAGSYSMGQPGPVGHKANCGKAFGLGLYVGVARWRAILGRAKGGQGCPATNGWSASRQVLWLGARARSCLGPPAHGGKLGG